MQYVLLWKACMWSSACWSANVLTHRKPLSSALNLWSAITTCTGTSKTQVDVLDCLSVDVEAVLATTWCGLIHSPDMTDLVYRSSCGLV